MMHLRCAAWSHLADSDGNTGYSFINKTGGHGMNIKQLSLWAAMASATLAGCAGMGGAGGLSLDGSKEVPPVSTAASGSGSITVGADMSVSGKITTTGLNGTVAHIHNGAAGANGPVIIPLTKSGDNEWLVPAGAKLTAEQYEIYKKGGLYVNVHTVANKGGEIRDQLRP